MGREEKKRVTMRQIINGQLFDRVMRNNILPILVAWICAIMAITVTYQAEQDLVRRRRLERKVESLKFDLLFYQSALQKERQLSSFTQRMDSLCPDLKMSEVGVYVVKSDGVVLENKEVMR